MEVRDLIARLLEYEMNTKVYLDVGDEIHDIDLDEPKWSDDIFLTLDDESFTLVEKKELERLESVEDEYSNALERIDDLEVELEEMEE